MEVVSSHKTSSRRNEIGRSSKSMMIAPKSTSAIEKVIPQSPLQIFDKETHKPPRIDQFGYNKETHKGRELLNRNAKNILTEDVRVPQWWGHKNIRDPNFGKKHGSISPKENE